MLKPASVIDYVASCSVIDATSTLGTLLAHVLIFRGQFEEIGLPESGSFLCRFS